MRVKARVSLGRVVIAATVAAVAAGCGAKPPVASGEGVVIAKVESAAWNAPPEPGLFRVTFDARRMGEIRREARTFLAPEGMDSYTTERALIVREAGRELEARGLCKGNAKLVTLHEEGDGKSGVSAVLKCFGPLF